jgi:hypothetical protein
MGGALPSGPDDSEVVKGVGDSLFVLRSPLDAKREALNGGQFGAVSADAGKANMGINSHGCCISSMASKL